MNQLRKQLAKILPNKRQTYVAQRTTITASPLPTLDPPRIKKLGWDERLDHRNAYNMILQAEAYAVNQGEDVMSARVAGYLLLEFSAQADPFGLQACTAIVNHVISPPQDHKSNQNQVIFEVGKLYRDKLIRLFWTSTTSYPPPSSHPSRSSFDTLEDMIRDSMEPTGNDYRTSRKKALARDGFRCIITGMIDETSFRNSAGLRMIASRDHANTIIVNACHILNESTMQGIDPAGTSKDGAMASKTHYAAGAMAILEQFGFAALTEAFKKPGGVHEVWNLLSLDSHLHAKFDRLNLWFEHTNQPNRYKVCVFYEEDEEYIRRNFVGPKPYLNGAPMVVEFTSMYTQAPAPNSDLLALHATCARVAHMSGAAEFFDKLQWDAEETRVLAFDGTSAELLSNLMSPFAVTVGAA